jgi:neutral amino acid transport system substrate-binding protein
LEECDLESDKVLLQCQHDNADSFAAHYADRWDDQPFPTAHFYYDAVLLLAMGLQYSIATGQPDPLAPQLQDLVIEMSNEAKEDGRWSDIGSVMSRLSQGVPVSLMGAANRYSFSEFGEAEHELVDVWQVRGQRYIDRGTLQLSQDPW